VRGAEERLGLYRYRWDMDCFPLTADSLALGKFCTLKPGDRVVDLGCGAGLLLLLCACRVSGLTLTGVELADHAASLARENLADNGLSGTILTGDLRYTRLPRADLVLSNPPWYPASHRGDAAHVALFSLDELCAAAGRALGDKGRFALVYDPLRLAALLAALRENRLEPKRLQLCRHRPDKPPFALLAEAVKGGRPGLEYLPDRITQEG